MTVVMDKVKPPAVAASGDDLFFQCLLSQGDKRTTGWIEARGAKKGRKVELKDGSGGGDFWVVLYVYQPGRDISWLRDKQRKDRGSLWSLRGK